MKANPKMPDKNSFPVFLNLKKKIITAGGYAVRNYFIREKAVSSLAIDGFYFNETQNLDYPL